MKLGDIPKKACSSSIDTDDVLCSTRRILVLCKCIPSTSFANESLMDPSKIR